MRQTDSLFILIKSLSRTEKRHFKLFASRHTIGEQNSYILLFNKLDRQERYDEAAIKEEVADSIPSERFADIKYYLYNTLLKSLRIYHSSETTTLRIREHLDYAEILLHKQLHDDCLRMLAKTRKLILTYHKLGYLSEITDLTIRCLGDRDPAVSPLQLEDAYDGLLQDIENSRNYTERSNHYLRLRLTAFRKIRKLVSLPADERKRRLDQILHEMFPDGCPEEELPEAMHTYHLVAGRTALLKHEYLKSYEHNIRRKELIEEEPALATDPDLMRLHISILRDTALAQIHLGRFDECRSTVTTMQTVAKRPEYKRFNFDRMDMVRFTAFRMEFLMAATRCEFAAAIDLYEENRGWLLDRLQGTRRLELMVTMAYVNFCAGHFDIALNFLNKCFEQEELSTLYDISAIYILHFLTHFELRNFSTLEYLMRSAHRALVKRDAYGQYEKTAFKYLRRLIKHVDAVTFYEVLIEFQQALGTAGNPGPHVLDLSSWVRSKLAGKPLGKILQEEHRPN